MYTTTTADDGGAEQSLLSLHEQRTHHSSSLSVSPVDRPFTSQIPSDMAHITHSPRVGAAPSQQQQQSASRQDQSKESNPYGLRPPRLDLVAALSPRMAVSALTSRSAGAPSSSATLPWRAVVPRSTERHAPTAASTPRLRLLASFGSSKGAAVEGSARPAPPTTSATAAAESDSAASLASLCRVLPWWKVILIHPGYRAHLTELATITYRAEMKLLAQTPEQISSAQGKDRLSGTVMAQYVALPGRAVWSVRHPRSLIQHSTLETMRVVALHAMPPTMNPQQRMQQVAAVEQHLRGQRRTSVLKTADMKRCDQQDVLAGRVPLPDPFDSEAETILARNAALLAGPPPVVTVGAQGLRDAIGTALLSPAHAPDGSGVGAAGVEAGSDLGLPLQSRRVRDKAQQLELYHFPSPPPSPRSRALGLKRSTVSQAVRTTPYGTLVRSPSRLAADEVRAARAESQRVRDEALSAAFPGGGLHLSPEEHAARLAAEALARFDGTNNLYGLSYFWDAPFPPAGFIRETPEPRRAMWPDDVREEVKQAEAARQRKEAETLVDRVNERARKLQYCRRYGLRANMAKLLKEEEEEEAEANGDGSGAGAKGGKPRAMTDEQRELSVLKPTYDGALHINVVQLGGAAPRTSTAIAAEAAAARSTVPSSSSSSSASTSARCTHFLGTFRQSLLLIHFKIYCCALYEEQRLRRGGGTAHLTALPIAARLVGQASSSSAAGAVDIYADETLLSAVPHIPSPVLRVQKGGPGLGKSNLRHTPQLEQVQPALCWEGLIPPLPQDPTSPAVHVWRYLHQASFAARQSLRDVFNSLDHDADGRLVKQTFVEFVLDLLHLFFPTHLHDVHVAIAEEEWVFRGTTENVSFDVFFEKFFTFPFIFHRSVADVTEDDYIEFWSLVRICLFETVATAPALLSFEKTLMVPVSASEVAAALAGSLVVGSSVAGSPLSETSKHTAAATAAAAVAAAGLRDDACFVEAAGSPMRMKKVTGTCTASAAERMRVEKTKNMGRLLGTNTSLSTLAASVQQQQQQQQQELPGAEVSTTHASENVSFVTSAGLDRHGTSRSLGHMSTTSGGSTTTIAAGTGARGPAVRSKAESMVALMQKEKTALKGVQAASSQYAAAVADVTDQKGGILLSAVFGPPDEAHRGHDEEDDEEDEDDDGGVDEEDKGNAARSGQAGATVTAKRSPHTHSAMKGKSATASSPRTRLHRRRRLSLLGPIMGFTPVQVMALYRSDYEHEEDYLLYQALSEVLRKDPVVRQLPPSRQYGVALSRGHQLVQARLDALAAVRVAQEEEEALAAAKAQRNRRDLARHNSIGVEELGDGLLRGAEGVSMQAALRQAVLQQKAQQGQSGGVAAAEPSGGGAGGHRTRRVAEAAQLRRAVLRQLEEDRQLAQLLQSSQRYQDSTRRRQARFNKALAKVESTASAWELHVDGVYDLTEPEATVEDKLLRYLSEVSPEVFDSRISLRERFLVHERFLEERRRLGREKTGLSLPSTGVTGAGAVVAGGGASLSNIASRNPATTTAMASSTLLPTTTLPAGAATSAGGGILGLGYGDTVVLRAPAEATTVLERLARLEQTRTAEELYLASMDVARTGRTSHGASADSAAGAGEAARATIRDGSDGAAAADPSLAGSSRPLSRRRASSRHLTSYAAGVYPVRPMRVSLGAADTDVVLPPAQASGPAEGKPVNRQALIDALLRDSLLGPSDDNDASSSRASLAAEDTAALSPFLLRRAGSEGGVVPVLASPATSDTDSSVGARHEPRRATAARVRSRADGTTPLKRIPSSKWLSAANRATERHSGERPAPTSARGHEGRRTHAFQMEMDEGRAAAAALAGLESSVASSASTSTSVSWYGAAALPRGGPGASFVGRQSSEDGPARVRGPTTRLASVAAVSASRQDTGTRATHDNAPTTTTATASTMHLDQHTQCLLENLKGPLLLPRQPRTTTRASSSKPIVHSHVSTTADWGTAPASSDAYNLGPHRPPFASGHAEVVSARPHAAPTLRAAQEAMAAATRVLDAGESARHHHSQHEPPSRTTMMMTAAGEHADVDLARRLASQRARDERWTRLQHTNAAATARKRAVAPSWAGGGGVGGSTTRRL